MKRMTTSEVAQKLGVAQVTVNVWCLQGKFPNAAREDTPRGAVWTIPESDLKGFEKPKRGRIPQPTSGTEKPATAKANASNGASTSKKRGKK